MTDMMGVVSGEGPFSVEVFNRDHADCPLAGIKKRPLVGGSYTLALYIYIVISIVAIYSQCPLCRGSPLVGGSVMESSTV